MIFMLLKLLKLQIAKFLALKTVDRLEKCVVELFHWCLVWSIGSMLDAEGRDKFDIFLRGMCQEKAKKVFPEKGSVFDYSYNMAEERFESESFMGVLETSHSSPFFPTRDAVNSLDLADLYVQHNVPVLIVGPLSSGKSRLAQQFLNTRLSSEFQAIRMQFSLETENHMIRQKLQENMEQVSARKYKVMDEKRGLLFIEDVNMPKRTVYGAKYSIEFLRYLMNEKKYWD